MYLVRSPRPSLCKAQWPHASHKGRHTADPHKDPRDQKRIPMPSRPCFPQLGNPKGPHLHFTHMAALAHAQHLNSSVIWCSVKTLGFACNFESDAWLKTVPM